MQVAQDAPKLLPNLLAICAWGHDEQEKSARKRKQRGNKSKKIKCCFTIEIPFLSLYEPHLEYGNRESFPV